jgi:hypothetical protein
MAHKLLEVFQDAEFGEGDGLEAASNDDANRRVRIALHRDDPHEKWVFRFHPGKGSRKQNKPIELLKGKAIEVDIKRARAWLGWFTIPHDLQGERDETKVREMKAFWDCERSRTLNAFGDYPRPRKVADGMDPIGPHRMPRFVITVIDGDGEPWEKIDMHELYGIGEFDDLTFTDPQQELKDENIRLLQTNNELLKQMAVMQGQIQAIMAMVKPAVATK